MIKICGEVKMVSLSHDMSRLGSLISREVCECVTYGFHVRCFQKFEGKKHCDMNKMSEK